MKKYFLKESKQEIAVGQTIELCTPITTSYGRGVVTTEVEVTESVLKKLISDGFVVEEDLEEEEIKQVISSLRPYVKNIAKKIGIDYNSAYMFLGLLTQHPLTHLTMLIEAMADTMNSDKTMGDSCFFLHPLKGFTPIKVKQSHIPGLFYDEADAHKAYNILRPIINQLLSGK